MGLSESTRLLLPGRRLGKCKRNCRKYFNHLIRWGHIELAMNLLNESINTTSGDTKINSEYILATIYYRLGDLNTALKIYNNIKYKYEERGNNRGVAVTLHQLGMIHQDQGNYEEAVKMYNQSLKIQKSWGIKAELQEHCTSLEMIHYASGQLRRSSEKV